MREEREAEGGHRRTYHITDKGREVLAVWMQDQTPVPVELRETGLLKLYFGALVDAQTLSEMATAQAMMHRQRLQEYEAIVRQITPLADVAFALATLQIGLRYEEASITFWENIAKNQPGSASTGAKASSSS